MEKKRKVLAPYDALARLLRVYFLPSRLLRAHCHGPVASQVVPLLRLELHPTHHEAGSSNQIDTGGLSPASNP